MVRWPDEDRCGHAHALQPAQHVRGAHDRIGRQPLLLLHRQRGRAVFARMPADRRAGGADVERQRHRAARRHRGADDGPSDCPRQQGDVLRERRRDAHDDRPVDGALLRPRLRDGPPGDTPDGRRDFQLFPDGQGRGGTALPHELLHMRRDGERRHVPRAEARKRRRTVVPRRGHADHARPARVQEHRLHQLLRRDGRALRPRHHGVRLHEQHAGGEPLRRASPQRDGRHVRDVLGDGDGVRPQ